MKKFPTSTSKSVHHSARPLSASFCQDSQHGGCGQQPCPTLRAHPLLPASSGPQRTQQQQFLTGSLGRPKMSSPPCKDAQWLKKSYNVLIGFQDKKENEHTENFPTNTEHRLGKLSGYPVNRMQSRINQNVVKFYSPKTIRLYLDLTK